MPLIPAAFQFRYTFAVPQVMGPKGRGMLNLPESAVVPFPSTIDGHPGYAQLRVGWNRDGLGFSLIVNGKKSAPDADPDGIPDSDGLFLWIDTRDTQNIHRASRYCHLFFVAATGGGERGQDPFVKQFPVPRAKDDAPRIDEESVVIEARTLKSGYQLDAWFPADTLNGYDPASQPRLGFYAQVRDTELGNQPLIMGDDFPYEGDPSLWASLELVIPG